MKKNLISIIILALLIVNIVLTAIMMFSVVGASKKTAALVDNIAEALDLELVASNGDKEQEETVSMADTEVYNLSEDITVTLKPGEDGKAHYALGGVALSINTKAEDGGYKSYGSDLSTKETLIRSEIGDVFSGYTLEEAQSNQQQIKQEILGRLQKLFDSKFIYNVSFDFMYQ